ncbi:LysM peptidoglycan-binding domain-containing protein [Cohnella pontilimi]|uniref:LysM peptidoglycan-binding domain-containing protein n=1 Tax=Cohnella pontilimi TaxID=2564100 RepID=A0A4U0FAV7_9BACL|nr:cell wall hydrolase [Cohnella pontilimi]TJY41294.1 LysM peptidoglycan-binding domain-containing protein [Cohnella pontilimi]
MKINWLTKITAATLAVFVAVGSGAAMASAEPALYIGDEPAEMSQSIWLVDGKSYAPVKEFSEMMGWVVDIDDGTGQITVSNVIGDQLSIPTEQTIIRYNGHTYETSESVKVKDGNVYYSLRILAESMHANVGWRKEERKPVVTAEPVHVVESGETLWGIAKQYQTTVKELQLRNGLKNESLTAGQALKVVIPDFMAAKSKSEIEVNQADLMLLANLVQIEAGNEPYEGKLAVACVVMNRVDDPDYPDTVKGVIYEPKQFSPAGNGKLANVKPSKDSLKAAKAALSGDNNVPGAVYFFNPKLEPAKLKKVKVVAKIGNHVFAK